jgi:AcrR family transcriptional regulator
MAGKAELTARGGTRELILDAARAEIAEHSYDAATMRSIARRASVDPRLVRYYFPTKESLAVEALGKFDVAAALARTGDRGWPDVVAIWTQRAVEWRAHIASAVSAEPTARSPFVDSVRDLTDRWQGPADPAGLRTLITFSHILGVWMVTNLDVGDTRDEHFQRILVDCACRGLAKSLEADDGAAADS